MITIVVLIILASVVISLSIVDNGIFNKAKYAKDKTIEAKYNEEDALSEYELKIAEVIGGSRESELKECTINISEGGEISVEAIEGIRFAHLAIIENGKYVDCTKTNTYNIVAPNRVTSNFYVIAIDENANIYKSNTIEYEGKAVYLYNEGDKCTTITGGWKLFKDSNTSGNINDYNYMELNSNNGSYCGIGIYTKNSIDLTNYAKLKMDVTVISKGYTGATSGGAYHMGINTNNNDNLNFINYVYSTGYKQDIGENLIFEIDLSGKNGNYYIGVQSARFHLKINKIWLEP